MRESTGSISQVSSNAGTGFFEGQHDVTEGGAAGNVMAVYGAAERDVGEEVFLEVFAELLQVSQWESVQFDVPVEAETDGITDDLMGFAERDTLVREVGGCGHGVEVAGLRCGAHALDSEVEGAGEVWQDTEETGEGVGDIEDLFLTFLEVFVVGQRQPLDQCGKCGGGTEQAGGFAASKFGEVRFFFCGMAEEPVEKASGRSTKPNSAVA